MLTGNDIKTEPVNRLALWPFIIKVGMVYQAYQRVPRWRPLHHPVHFVYRRQIDVWAVHYVKLRLNPGIAHHHLLKGGVIHLLPGFKRFYAGLAYRVTQLFGTVGSSRVNSIRYFAYVFR